MSILRVKNNTYQYLNWWIKFHYIFSFPFSGPKNLKASRKKKKAASAKQPDEEHDRQLDEQPGTFTAASAEQPEEPELQSTLNSKPAKNLLAAVMYRLKHPDEFRGKNTSDDGRYVDKRMDDLSWRSYIGEVYIIYWVEKKKYLTVYCCNRKYASSAGLISHIYRKHVPQRQRKRQK